MSAHVEKWLQAATRYRAVQARKTQEEGQVLWTSSDHLAKEEEAKGQAAQVTQATEELATFLEGSEGAAALCLLKESKRHLVFGEEREGGYAEVFYIDGEGLHCSHEPNGMWTAYAAQESLPKPRIVPISPLDAIRAAVWCGNRQPDSVLSWLRKELDNIADSVPQLVV